MHFYLQIVHFLKWLGMGFIGEKVRATASVFLIGKSLVFKSLFLRLLERFFLVGWLVGWVVGFPCSASFSLHMHPKLAVER